MGEVVELKRDEETGRFVEGTQPAPMVSSRSPERQAAVVALSEAVGTETAADVTEIPRRTIRRWGADGEILSDGSKPVPPANRELARELLAEECEKVVAQYITHLQLPDVVAKASARDAGTVVGILVDKAIKLRGEDKPNPLEAPLTLKDYFLSLAAQAKGRAEQP